MKCNAVNFIPLWKTFRMVILTGFVELEFSSLTKIIMYTSAATITRKAKYSQRYCWRWTSVWLAVRR